MPPAMKVLLLNPPAPRLCLRDYFCAESAKADYLWPPLDLLVLSGLLEEGFDVEVLDALAEGLDETQAASRIERASPDAVVALAAGFRLDADMAFLARARGRRPFRLVVSGDVPRAQPAWFLERYPEADGVLMDFADPSVAEYLRGGKGVPAVRVRGPEPAPPTLGGPLSYPLPRHERFPLARYRLPLLAPAGAPITCLLTALGCPFSCGYCSFPSLPYRLRPMGEVLDEWAALLRLGVGGVFVRDLSFGPGPERIHAFCEGVRAADRPLPWTCEVRLDLLDEASLTAMKGAGCACLLFGLENLDPAPLERLGRRVDAGRLRRLALHCRHIGLPTLGHYILGLPGQSLGSEWVNVVRACAFPVDYMAFNRTVPRLGAALRGAGPAGPDLDLDVSTGRASLRWLLAAASLLFYAHPRRALRLVRLLGPGGLSTQAAHLWKRTIAPPW